MALIYVVEDDKNIQEIETIALKNSGYQVEVFGCAKDFWDEMEKQYAMTFHKGGGAQADRSGTEFIRRYGRENLEKVAKLHFKNTERL